MGGGKIFHNSFNDPASWDKWHGLSKDDHPVPKQRPVNGIAGAAHFDWGPVDVPDEAMGDHKTVSRAIEFLGQGHDRPFFLAVGLIRPHLPWYVPRKYFDEFPLSGVVRPEVKADDLDDIPAAGRAMARPGGDHRKVVQAGQWDKAVQGYLASIAFADAEIGRLLDALDASPHARNTIIVFWGDHGWHLGQKEHWRKFALWEEATRVPLIVVAPGVTHPGTRSDRTVSLLDLYPTLIELCGLPQKTGLEGESLVAPAEGAGGILGPPGGHHPRPEQPCRAVRAMAVHPLRRRHRGTVRPRRRPPRMDEPGRRLPLGRGQA